MISDSTLTRLLGERGPIVSVALNTPSDVPNAQELAALRWRNLRRDLEQDGAPPNALEALGPLAEEAHADGDLLVAYANQEGLLHSSRLLWPFGSVSPNWAVSESQARVDALPDLLPLLHWRQQHLPYMAVATDRLGADIVAVRPDTDDHEVSVSGEELHITRSHPGGWSQRRFQQRAENRWEANAGEVAESVTKLADETRPRLIVVSGDVRAVQFLRAQLPERVTALLHEVQGPYDALDTVATQAAELAANLADEESLDELRRFRAERDRGEHLAVEGTGPTLAALATAQVETVLLQPGRTAPGTAWFGPEPVHAAARAQTLHDLGVEEPEEGHLTGVVVRGALGCGATVRILPDDLERRDDVDPKTAPADGIGALLRYPVTTPEPETGP